MNNLFSLQAEMAVVGALLTDSHKWIKVRHLKSKDFYDGKNALLFDVLIEKASKGLIIDIVTLAEELRQKKLIEKIGGGESYLIELVQNTPSAENIEAYASIVLKFSKRRKIAASIDAMTVAIMRNDENVEEIILNEIHAINSSMGNSLTIRAISLSEFLSMELPPRENILEPWLPKALRRIWSYGWPRNRKSSL